MSEKLKNYQVVNAIRWEAQQKVVAAINNFNKALEADIKAQAEFDASTEMTYQGFIEQCLAHVRSNNATWSGGPHGPGNVVEASIREAWINAASDMQIRNLFKH